MTLQTPNSTINQPNITKFGFDMKRILNNHPPPLGPQRQQYLSCYWPNFDQILKIRFLEKIIRTITTSSATITTTNIYPLFGTQFWLNFKARCLGLAVITTTTEITISTVTTRTTTRKTNSISFQLHPILTKKQRNFLGL